MTTDLKEWTFLHYANGHNELEPETWRSVRDLLNQGNQVQINVVVQISRETPAIIQLIRPQFPINTDDQWCGVRRYEPQKNGGYTFQQIDTLNMASGQSLYDFIIWGVRAYPAQRYLLSLAGHIYQFVGMCPDYSGKQPTLLGFPQLSTAISQACDLLNITLDLLILDTCYAGTVEILYELSPTAKPSIEYMLTYIGKGPLAGLPYSDLLTLLGQVSQLDSPEILKNIVDRLPLPLSYQLIAFRLNGDLLQLSKQLFDQLAATYLSCRHLYEKDFSPEELLSVYGTEYPWSLFLKPLYQVLKSLVIAQNFVLQEERNVLPIHILYQKIPDEQRKSLYNRLRFAQQNHWTALLCDLPFEALPEKQPPTFQPMPVGKNILAAFLCAGNEQLSPLEQDTLVEALIAEKRWLLL